MKLYVLSDLYNEFSPFSPFAPKPGDFDLVILVGDIDLRFNGRCYAPLSDPGS
jgi:hypothetical protein